MNTMRRLSLLVLFALTSAGIAQAPLELSRNWRIADITRAPESGERISSPGYDDHGWYAATVPATALTSLVNDGVYPDPAYGENDRPESIPETLNQTAFWYRTTVPVPASFHGRHTWIRFNGINYSAELWINGQHVGEMRGAFKRFSFDISRFVTNAKPLTVAVRVAPQPHPGVPHEHTLKAGVAPNGGITSIDGPTFLDTIGWDWMPAIRDRDSGIWRSVELFSTGDVVVRDPYVTTKLPLPDTSSADLTVAATVENLSDESRTVMLRGTITSTVAGVRPLHIERRVTVAPHETQQIHFSAADTPALHVLHPHLWWPNGYGDHPLYTLKLEAVSIAVSDTVSANFGIRQIGYELPGSDNLAISVNGVPVFIRGGDWGMDEELKRIPHDRLEAQIRMHAVANLNLIRNWVGQSTSDDLYDLADKYGILLWDEFFQPNPSDGPNPDDLETYLANVRDKVLRYRNHPSIMLWCARNEGLPPVAIDTALRKMLPELDPGRLYQASSTDGRGVHSSGPYRWRTPQEYYKFPDTEAFKTEIGSVSIPTLDSVHGMMPQKDWESINDDWAEHDFAKGASGSDKYRELLAARYVEPLNLADFVRKGQLMNYESFRAMYEGRLAKMYAPSTGIVTWMSNPAQPSFVWQIYHHDLEPMSSFFAVQSAAEPIHLQWNEVTNELEIINNTPNDFQGAMDYSLYRVDGSRISLAPWQNVVAKASARTVLKTVDVSKESSPVAFLFGILRSHEGETISRNVYWRGTDGNHADLTAMDTMPSVELNAEVKPPVLLHGEERITVTLTNPTAHIAVASHVQLRNSATNARVLPAFYSANYITLMPYESQTLTITVDPKLLHASRPLLTVDGWNITVKPLTAGVEVRTNTEADPAHWPVTHLPYATQALR